MNKSHIISAGECSREAWFQLRNGGARRSEPTAADELLAHYGRLVGELARREFPFGVLIEAESFSEAVVETRRHLAAGTQTIFEAAFSHGEIGIKADVLRREGDAFDLIEVKAGLEPKEYFEDVAVQKWVLDRIGISVTPYLMLLDASATLESHSLFKLIPCADEVEALILIIDQRIAAIKEAVAADKPPKVVFSRTCKGCDFLAECLPDLPDHNPLTLYRGGQKIDWLLAQGIFDLSLVPDGLRLSDIQRRQIECIRTGQTWVSPDLKRRLAEVRYPLHFLDFEALAHPIPQHISQHPYDVTPFHFSCHRMRAPQQAPEHLEFLTDPPADPRPAFAEALVRAVGEEGSIVVYTSYERRIISGLAAELPQFKTKLQALITRLYDLHAVVRSHVYHPAFRGSFSIKSVLPALVPDASYANLAIADGMAAVLSYLKMDFTLPTAERQEIAADLRRYCAQDSLAMLLVYEALCRLADGARR